MLTAAALSFTEEKESRTIQRRAAILAATLKPQSEEEVERMLKRAFFFCEDKEWDSAYAYAERILDYNPEIARAYEIKLMCEVRAQTPDDLARSMNSLTMYSAFKKAVRFANDELKQQLNAYEKQIQEGLSETARRDADAKKAREALEAKESVEVSNQFAAKEEQYCKASELLRKAKQSMPGPYRKKLLQEAMNIFYHLGTYRDAPALLRQARYIYNQ